MQNMRHSFLGIVIICAVSIIFCLVSTFLLYETKKKLLPHTDILIPYPIPPAKYIHEPLIRSSFIGNF